MRSEKNLLLVSLAYTEEDAADKLVQLYEARQAIRPGKEQEAENRAQEVYGEKYNPLLMFDSKKSVSRMLHEDIERQAVRRMMRQAHKEQQTFQKKKSEQER